MLLLKCLTCLYVRGSDFYVLICPLRTFSIFSLLFATIIGLTVNKGYQKLDRCSMTTRPLS